MNMNKMSKFQKNDRRDSYMKLKQQLEDSEDNEDIEEQFDEAIECKLYIYILELISIYSKSNLFFVSSGRATEKLKRQQGVTSTRRSQVNDRRSVKPAQTFIQH